MTISTPGTFDDYIIYDENLATGFVSIVPAPVTIADV